LLPSLSRYPEAYISSDDNIALNMNIAFHELGSIVPKDIIVTGFDSSYEYSRLIPKFSTVFIDKEELGRRAVETLYWRIDHQDRPFSTTYIPSKIQLSE
jgi:LacI family transcriptional regulator